MPADNFYDDAPEGASSAGSPDEKAEPKGEHTEGKTALIDSDLCPGMKPGEEMVLKIRRVMDKQYEVEYAPEPEHEDKAEGPGGRPQMPESMGGDREMLE